MTAGNGKHYPFGRIYWSLYPTPIPTGPIRVDLLLADGGTVDRVEWRYPEMKNPLELDHEITDGRVRFQIPRLIVYGMSVIHLKSDRDRGRERR